MNGNTATITAGRRPVYGGREPARRAFLDTYAKTRQASSAEVRPQPVSSRPTVPSTSAVTARPIDNFIYKPVAAKTPAAIPAAHTEITPPAMPETTSLVADERASAIDVSLGDLYQDSLSEQLAADNKSASHLRTIIVSALVCGVLSAGMYGFVSKVDTQPAVAQPIGSPVIEVEAPLTQPKTEGKALIHGTQDVVRSDPSHPVKLLIGSIGVNARVEGLGKTPDGLIAVPKAYGLAGWYNQGSVPGEAGPAVLVGHYTEGGGGVFDKLGQVKNGDLVTLTNGRGQKFTYKIVKKAEYARDKVPMQDIFKKGDSSRLEIITCAGKWQVNKYDKRLVVTAELVK